MLPTTEIIVERTTAEEVLDSLHGIWLEVAEHVELHGFQDAGESLDFYTSMYSCLMHAAAAGEYYVREGNGASDQSQRVKARTLMSAFEDLMSLQYTRLLSVWRNDLSEEQINDVIKARRSAEKATEFIGPFSKVYNQAFSSAH